MRVFKNDRTGKIVYEPGLDDLIIAICDKNPKYRSVFDTVKFSKRLLNLREQHPIVDDMLRSPNGYKPEELINSTFESMRLRNIVNLDYTMAMFSGWHPHDYRFFMIDPFVSDEFKKKVDALSKAMII